MQTQQLENNKSEYGSSALKLTLLCMILYAVSYLGRKSYDSSINEIIGYYGVDKASAGLVGTLFFIVYAIGQVVHGLLCKRYNIKKVVFFALVVTAFCNFGVGLMPKSGFQWIKFIWLVNGFAMASLWSAIILLLNTVLASIHMRKALFMLSFPVSLGTFFVYGMSALCSFLDKFKLTFYFSGALLLLMGLIWLFSVEKLSNKCRAEKIKVDGIKLEVQKDGTLKEKTTVNKGFWALFGVLAFFAIANNFIKDGLTSWTPTILVDKYGLENWVSVLLTILLPCFAFLGANAAVMLNKRITNYITLCGLLYVTSAVVFGVLIACLGLNQWLITLGCFILVSVLMAGVNNVLTSVFPMQSKGVNAGFIAGLIDGFCYVGSAGSAYGLGAIVDGVGNWDMIMYIYLGVSCLCVLTVFVVNLIKKMKKANAI